MKLIIAAVALTGLTAVQSFALPSTNFSWNWPFGHPDLCHDDPDDGLPEYFGPRYMDKDGGTFLWNTIACPKELIQTCRTPPPADPHGFPPLKAGKDCKGGFACRNSVSFIKDIVNTPPAGGLPSWITPNIKVQNKTLPHKGLRITRRYMLQRAVGWIASHSPYHGHGTNKNDYEMCAAKEIEDPGCPQYDFVGACPGMGHLITRNAQQVNGENKDLYIPISCDELLPGDIIANHGSKGITSHWQTFRKWVNKTGPTFETWVMGVYQMGGGGGANYKYISKTRPQCGSAAKPSWKGKNCAACGRYKLIKEEPGLNLKPAPLLPHQSPWPYVGPHSDMELMDKGVEGEAVGGSEEDVEEDDMMVIV